MTAVAGPAQLRRPAGAAGAALGPAVFALAHHDDEVFCAGHLWRALAEGRPVRLLWATAGGLAPARRRVAEGARVGRLLGLAPAACHDMELPDQGALAHVEAIAAQIEALAGAGGAGGEHGAPVIYVPAYEGGHPDHDALNLAAALLRTRRPELEARELPLYRLGGAGLNVQTPRPAAWTSADAFDILALDDAALALRRRLALANASQVLPSLLPLLALACAAGRRRREPSRRLPAHDYARPPHRRPLLYELYTRRRFDEFRGLAIAVLRGAAVQ